MSETFFEEDTPMDDSIISDLSLLGLHEETVELDADRNSRIALLLAASKSGSELYSNMEEHLPSSGGTFGKTLVMNRVVKFFIGKSKLPKECNIGWKSATEDMLSRVDEAFDRIVVGSTEWKDIFRTILKGVDVKIPKAAITATAATAKRKIVDNVSIPVVMLTQEVAESIASPVEHSKLCDRVALLACALVDPDLADRWAELAAPVSAEKRPAVMDRNIVHLLNAKRTVLAEIIMRSRTTYGNPFSDLSVFIDFTEHVLCRTLPTYA